MQNRATVSDVEDGDFRHDDVDLAARGERVQALGEDLRFAAGVAVGVGHDKPSGADVEVHRAADTERPVPGSDGSSIQ
ncbi:hypothetical protein ACIQPR_47015 [Streptomyces sp. NPDC091280]|uniref:hypothetical protein n=1 Tax=Streptomyces sp. NPDC091280 TaxID=3365984 RepID=UPI00382FAFDB